MEYMRAPKKFVPPPVKPPFLKKNIDLCKLKFMQFSLRGTFVEKPKIKIFSFQNWRNGFNNAILDRQSFEGHCCESEHILIIFISFNLGKCNAMQCRM